MGFTVEVSGLVKSTPSAIHDILKDVESWYSWNNFVLRLGRAGEDGLLGGGDDPLRAGDIAIIQVKAMQLSARIVKFDESEVSWCGSLLSNYVFSGYHYLKIEQVDSETVRVCHGEKFEGGLSHLLKLVKGQDKMRSDYQNLLDGLTKKVAELLEVSSTKSKL